MSYENLIAQLGFKSASLNDYTASVTFRAVDHASSRTDKSASSKDADERFSTFMDSLKSSNDSKKTTGAKEKIRFSEDKSSVKADDPKARARDTDRTQERDPRENGTGDVRSDDTKTCARSDDAGAAAERSGEAPSSSSGSSGQEETAVSADEARDAGADTETDTNTDAQTDEALAVAATGQVPVRHAFVPLSDLPEIPGVSADTEDAAGALSADESGEALSALSETLQALIDALRGAATEAQAESGEAAVSAEDGAEAAVSAEGEAVSTETEEMADAAGAAALLQPEDSPLLKLLGALLEQIGAQEGGTAEGTTAESGEESVLRGILASLQENDGAGLAEALQGLSDADLAALKEGLDAYLSGDLSAEELDALAGLMVQYNPALPLPAVAQPAGDPGLFVAVAGGAANADGAADVALRGDAGAADAASSEAAGKQPSSGNEGAAQAQGDEEPSGQSRDLQVSAITAEDAEGGEGRNVKAQEAGAANKQDQPAMAASQGAGERFLQASAAAQQSMTGAGSDASALGLTGVGGSGQVSGVSAATMNTAGAQAQSAGQAAAHPATQMVSMTIQRAVREGEETTIKLQLDPPELGRVEVKMSIDHDHTTKIVLTAEKAETHQMLQRDSQFLERAMSDAGLDAQGNLSFELASDGQAFEKGGSSDGSGGIASSGASGVDIESETLSQYSTMDWYVDPKTGRMHYNILA